MSKEMAGAGLRLAAPQGLGQELHHLKGLAKLDATDRRITERRTHPKSKLDKIKNISEMALLKIGIAPVMPITRPDQYEPTEADIEAYNAESLGFTDTDLQGFPRLAAVREAIWKRDTAEFAALYPGQDGDLA